MYNWFAHTVMFSGQRVVIQRRIADRKHAVAVLVFSLCEQSAQRAQRAMDAIECMHEHCQSASVKRCYCANITIADTGRCTTASQGLYACSCLGSNSKLKGFCCTPQLQNAPQIRYPPRLSCARETTSRIQGNIIRGADLIQIPIYQMSARRNMVSITTLRLSLVLSRRGF